MPIPSVSKFRTDSPPSIDALLQQALERDVSQRFQSAQSFLLAIEALSEVKLATREELRDEALAICGDPAVPTLGGDAFSVLRNALRGHSEDAQPDEEDIDYFLDRAGDDTE
jgi:hypothetical protein